MKQHHNSFSLQTTICAKVRIDGIDMTNMMFDIGVKQGCPVPPTLSGLYIEELETYLNEIDKDSSC